MPNAISNADYAAVRAEMIAKNKMMLYALKSDEQKYDPDLTLDLTKEEFRYLLKMNNISMSKFSRDFLGKGKDYLSRKLLYLKDDDLVRPI